jgi:hypothetical protein
MRLWQAALAELSWEKGAASSSEDMGFVVKSKANWEPGGNRASRGLVGSSSYELGLSGSTPRSWGSILEGLEPGKSGRAI